MPMPMPNIIRRTSLSESKWVHNEVCRTCLEGRSLCIEESLTKFVSLFCAGAFDKLCMERYEYLGAQEPAGPDPGQHDAGVGKGEMGSALMESLQISCFLTEELFGTPVKCVFPIVCQGVPFSQSGKIPYFCSGPISVDPICSQPNDMAGNPHRAQISQFELFELIFLLKLDKQLPAERFEATVSQSTVKQLMRTTITVSLFVKNSLGRQYPRPLLQVLQVPVA